MKKRILSGFVAICMLVSLGSVSNAVGEKEIVLHGDFDAQKAQSIADKMNGEMISETYSLLCIFGHNLAYGTGIEIFHRYYPTAPRCLERIYKIEYCTRCNYSNGSLIKQSAIFCCS